MRLPRFRVRTLMMGVAAMAMILGALRGLSESFMWYRQKSWAIQTRAWAAQVEARKGTPEERPGDAWLLQECRRLVIQHERWANDFRPHLDGLACLLGVALMPVLWLARRVARSHQYPSWPTRPNRSDYLAQPASQSAQENNSDYVVWTKAGDL